ncbi:MAG: DUF3168 domain-containing protein [Pseudomonadota bacterium]
MADPGFEVQKAIYDALTAALSVPVYDQVPDGAPKPYVTIDSHVTDNRGQPLNGGNDRRTMYLNVWSTFPGQEEVTTINAQIHDALNLKSLPLPVGCIGSMHVDTSTAREPDNRTFMGRVVVRMHVQHD